MKSPLLIGLAIGLMWLTSCVAPNSASLADPNRALANDELLTIWRFSRYADVKEVLDTSATHAVQMERAMQPLFEQIIPRIIADIAAGHIRVHEPDSKMDRMDEEPIADLAAHMEKAYGATFEQYAPLQVVFHTIQRRKQSARGYAAEDRELTLIVSDPAGLRPERRFGTVAMADLVELGYEVNTKEGSFPLLDYLAKCASFAYPIYYETTGLERGLRTLEAAFSTKQKVLEGAWSQIQWLAGEPNLTAFSPIEQPAAAFQEKVGSYHFTPNQDDYLTKTADDAASILTIEASLSDAEMPYLIGNWSVLSPYQSFLFFPKADGEWFTPDGVRLRFTELPEGGFQAEVLLGDGTTLTGMRS